MGAILIIAFLTYLVCRAADQKAKRIAAGRPRRFRAKGAVISTLLLGPLGLLGYAATRDNEDADR